MKFIIQALTTMAIVVGGAAALDNGVQMGVTFGGPHGKKYSDLDLASPGQTVRSITIRGNRRVDAVSLDVTDLAGQTTTFYHGGGGGHANTLTLAENEHIIGIEVHWDKYYGKTRVMYVEFTTDAGNTISGGKPVKNIGKDSAPEGYQLGGFVGICGKEIDSVGGIWTSIEPVA